MTTRNRRGAFGLWTLLLAAGTLIGVGELAGIEIGQAQAVIGRPLTPVSGAGVARRTTRRTVGRYGYGYGYAAGTVAALPGGCVRTTRDGVLVYNCAGTFYRPVYDGPDVVYVVD